ncbi:hypothetical protein B0H14DRAFT_3511851 [Mycena olivaceomarginata]|nr:hypothetical protein B0H14DRAFT_3511851 [Mycena olivaceomarginata]
MLVLLLVQQVVLVPGSACLPLPVPLAYECPASPFTPTALPTRNRIRPPHPAQAPYTTRPDCPGQRTRSSSTAPHGHARPVALRERKAAGMVTLLQKTMTRSVTHICKTQR